MATPLWSWSLFLRAWEIALQSDSSLHAELVPPRPLRGWFMLEVETSAHLTDLDVLIEAGGEVRHFPLDVGASLRGKRVLQLTEPTTRLRLERDSGAPVGRVTCRLKRLSRGFAASRMQRKIAAAAALGRIGPDAIGASTPEQLSDLYELCFRRRIGASGDGYREWRSGAGTARPPRIAPSLDVTVIIPCYRSERPLLDAAIASVMNQSTRPREVILIDDGSPEPIEFAATGPCPVMLHRLERNRGIAAATREGLERAQGTYIALLDHDDLLAPDAFAWVADALGRHPDAGIVYTDEDKIDEFGRTEPHFKPDYNYDLLLAQNYIGHLLVVRRDLASSAGGMGPGTDGSQDHDLILRCAERLPLKQIVHVPQVCYHWRRSARSTAADPAAKPYTAEAGLRAVQDHLRRRGTSATATHGRYINTYRVHWPPPTPAPLVSIIVPTRDGGDVLARCLDGLLARTDYPRLQVIVVDNQSRSEGTLSLLRQVSADRRVKILKHDAAFNFSAINNAAVAVADGTVVGLVNDDVEILDRDWLLELVGNALRDDIGCVGPKLLYPDRTIQHAGVILGIGGVAGHAHKHFANDRPGYFSRLHLAHEVSAVTGACLIVRKEIYQRVGGLDAEHLAVAFNDVDFCLRVRAAGYRNLWTPWAELIHHESKTRGYEDTPEKRERFRREAEYMLRRWRDVIESDPAYSPHLTRRREDFSLRTLD